MDKHIDILKQLLKYKFGKHAYIKVYINDHLRRK